MKNICAPFARPRSAHGDQLRKDLRPRICGRQSDAFGFANDLEDDGRLVPAEPVHCACSRSSIRQPVSFTTQYGAWMSTAWTQP